MEYFSRYTCLVNYAYFLSPQEQICKEIVKKSHYENDGITSEESSQHMPI